MITYCNKKRNRRIIPLSCLCTILWLQYMYHICCFRLFPRSVVVAVLGYCNPESTIHIHCQRSLKTQLIQLNFGTKSHKLPLTQTSLPRRQDRPPDLLGFLAQLLLEPPWQSKHLSASVTARMRSKMVTILAYAILEKLKIDLQYKLN